ncbi:acyltransferase [Chelatococcus sambhunathii]|uniref:Acyltransferase n=1 Tax=Chelatococcus sambhunathii TaxID=363953 RepID=A0ABU1DHY0_9HYPH|nr:acyltransferase [Chelatococcus sambhunathii]MDR4307728.1 acyltransferase [Chelatococcus sambhunathii]
MPTLQQQLDRHGGVGPGFDFVRLALATLVLFIHTSLIAPGVVGAENAPLFPGAPVERWALNYAVLPMFFALSGFLVAGSAERLSLGSFLTNRALRIFPALAVEITLSALVLGPLLTTLPLGEYFFDPRFASYFLNIFGAIHYELPGLFASNPEPGVVNGSLWTVPHELSCYTLLALFMAFGLHRNRRLLLLAAVGLYAVGAVTPLLVTIFPKSLLVETMNHMFVTRGAAKLVPIFLLGMAVYRYRDVLPFRRSYGLAAVAAFFAISAFGRTEWMNSPLFAAVSGPLLAYAVAVAGLTPELRLQSISGDYSYGIYLYGFPLQQTILALFPKLVDPALFFGLSFAASLAMAALSWRLIEKPILRMRRHFSLSARIHTEPRDAEAAAAAQAPAPTASRAVA